MEKNFEGRDQDNVDIAAEDLAELNELELATVGGGIGDPIAA